MDYAGARVRDERGKRRMREARVFTRGSATPPGWSARLGVLLSCAMSGSCQTAALRNRMDAIEQFAADVAHELKNPLSSLASAVETVGRVKDEAQKQKLLGIIREEGLSIEINSG